jgi:hypothetical protein
VLLAVTTGVVFRFLSRQQRSDEILRIAGAMAFAAAAAGGVLTVTGFAIGVAAVVWTGLTAGCLAWLSIPLWVLAMGRVLMPSRAVLPIPDTAAPAHRREA